MIPFQYLAFETVDRAANPVQVFNLTDNVSYGLVSYAPTVAPRNRATLTGNATYAEVTDTIQIEVLGATSAICVDNYERLMRAIEQGAQRDDYDSVIPVRIAAEVQGSTVGRLSALILGPAPGSAPATTSPELRVPLNGGPACWVMDATLTFVRRGLWLGEFQQTALLNTVGNPTVETVTFTGDQGLLGAPMAVSWFDSEIGTPTGTGTFYALTASQAYSTITGQGSLRLADWSTLTATNWTTVNDAANLPFQGTNILRFTRPTTTDVAFWPTGNLNIGPAPLPADTTVQARRQWFIVAAVRNNSTTVSFFLRARFLPFGSSGIGESAAFVTRPVLIDTSIQAPRLVVLGVVSGDPEVRNVPARIRLEVAANSVTGSATFDVSYCTLLATDDPSAAVVEMPDVGEPRNNIHVIARDVILKQTGQLCYLNFIAPPTANPDLLNLVGAPYSGDIDWTCISTSAAITLIGVDGLRWVFAAGANKANLQYRGRRRRAYRSPQ